MSKTPSVKAKTPAVEFRPGDVVLSKVKGFSAWPSVIVDTDTAPPSVKREKPKGGQHYLIRFMPTGEFGWPTKAEVSVLTTEAIDKYLEKEKKKTSKIYKGYELAKNPQKWITEKEAEAQKQVEIEANAQEDELEEEEEPKEKKAKGRKAAAPSGPSKKKKAAKDEEDAGSKKKARPARKRKAGDDSDDDGKPSKKKAKKDEEEDAALANDPEAVKIKEWRHQLQRAFLRDNVKPEPAVLGEYDETFRTIEEYKGLTIQYLSYSKIGKVMKKISQLDDSHIPENDGQYKFRERAKTLVEQWHGILNSKPNDSDAAPAVNGTAEKADDAAATAGPAGDVSVMTDA